MSRFIRDVELLWCQDFQMLLFFQFLIWCYSNSYNRGGWMTRMRQAFVDFRTFIEWKIWLSKTFRQHFQQFHSRDSIGNTKFQAHSLLNFFYCRNYRSNYSHLKQTSASTTHTKWHKYWEEEKVWFPTSIRKGWFNIGKKKLFII